MYDVNDDMETVVPTIRETARIVVASRGDLDADQVAEAAWMLWRSARRRAANSPSVKRDGVYGFQYSGSLLAVVIDLWPEYTWWSPEEQKRFSGSLYSYLRATNNAICIQPTHHPVWWIAQDFTKVAVRTVYGLGRSGRATKAEQRLTPHEAGEDREPHPVLITGPAGSRKVPEPMPTAATDRRSSAETLASVHDRRRKEREDRRQQVLKAVKNLKQPGIVGEVIAAMGAEHEASTIRGDLRELEIQGLVHSRQESREERTLRGGGQPQKASRASLYWAKSPVPPRTLETIIPGYAISRSPNLSPDRKARDRLAVALHGYIRRGSFSTRDLAERAEASVGTTYHAVRTFEEQGLIVKTNTPNGKSRAQQYYRIPHDSESVVRERSREARARLGKEKPAAAAVAAATAIAPELKTDVERDAYNILGVVAERGGPIRENLLFAYSDIDDRDQFNQAIELLIAGNLLVRTEVSGSVFYGTETPAISEPPPSVATAAITAHEVSDKLEQAFDQIRQAIMSMNGGRTEELEEKVNSLAEQNAKLQRALRAATGMD